MKANRILPLIGMTAIMLNPTVIGADETRYQNPTQYVLDLATNEYQNPTQWILGDYNFEKRVDELVKKQERAAKRKAIKIQKRKQRLHQSNRDATQYADSPSTVYTDNVSEFEIDLFERNVEAEAGNQCELGKRLAADVVINRVRSGRFSNSVYGVITQPGQFSSYTDGGMANCHPTDDTKRIVCEELINVTNSEVLFYTAGYYNPFCTPMFVVQDHYFGR